MIAFLSLFWKDEDIGCVRGIHCAFLALSIKVGKAWHAKCLEFGEKDNGAPSLLPDHYSEYGAFIVDPNGWHIEACFHGYQAEG